MEPSDTLDRADLLAIVEQGLLDSAEFARGEIETVDLVDAATPCVKIVLIDGAAFRVEVRRSR